jgi:hypothetical protein
VILRTNTVRKIIVTTWVVAGLSLDAGCIEIQQLLQGVASGDSSQNGPPGDAMDSPGDGSGDESPVVRLTASNTTPQLNEQLTLRCSVIRGGVEDDAAFDFQPAGGGLQVDREAGTATLIVAESDLGVARSFTCMGTTSAGVSEPSNTVLVIPTATEQ